MDSDTIHNPLQAPVHYNTIEISMHDYLTLSGAYPLLCASAPISTLYPIDQSFNAYHIHHIPLSHDFHSYHYNFQSRHNDFELFVRIYSKS